jgi:hypothetical protein
MRAPLIQPILFKTAFYWVAVFLARLLERFVHFALEDNPPGDFFAYLMTTFSWHRFSAISLWILALFLIYVTASEFSHLLDHRRPSRTDERIKLPQSNQPTRLGATAGGHGAPNKGEWDRRLGRLFEGRLAFRCQGYTCGTHAAGIRIRKPAETLAFWEVVGEFLQLLREGAGKG